MSVCVNFRTAKQLEPKQIFDELVHRAQRIVITSPEFPCVKLGTAQEALRGIEINQQENGYEVRVCSFANRSDLQLYSKVVDAMRELTGAEALYEEVANRISKVRGKAYLFFDEIQEVKDWERCINSARVDFDCDIYITGSNAKLLSGELATYLGGRYVDFIVYPFSFEEFLECRSNQ